MRSIIMILLAIPNMLFGQILLQPITDSIVMRDGKKLAADIYLPDTTQKYPVILIQTPYNRLYYRTGLPLGIKKNLKSSPYIFVIVDWRCFYGSAKACKPVPERGKDGYDIIDWIIKQSWSNGKVGTWGPSALGKIQYQTAKEQHPNHICAVPIVAGSQFEYQEYFPNGVLRTEYVDQLDALGYNLKSTILQHPYYDTWWQMVENANLYPEKIKIPMFLIGGWFDHNIDLMFRMFDTLLKASDPSVRDMHKFLVGPWSHNSVGEKKVGELEFPETEGVSDSFAMLFFDYWLRGAKNGWPLLEKYLLYEMDFGAFNEMNFIKTNDPYKEYYAAKSDTFFLIHEGVLMPVKSKNTGITEYICNPEDPSPTLGGPTLRSDLKQGPYDISSLMTDRTDNKEYMFWNHTGYNGIYIHGTPEVVLFVSSDRPDCDFDIRLFITKDKDTVHKYIMSDGVYRMRFRNGYSIFDTLMMTKDSIYKISVKLPPVYMFLWQFYNLGLMVSSSNYPRFDLNLNNGKSLYSVGDSLTVTNRIWTGGKYASCLIIPGQVLVGLEEQNFAESPEVYPNPARNRIFICPQTFASPYSFSIADINGKVVMKGETKVSGTFSIDISELKPQVYFLRIKIGNNSFVKKLVKIE